MGDCALHRELRQNPLNHRKDSWVDHRAGLDKVDKSQALSLLGFETQPTAYALHILKELEKTKGNSKFNTEHAMKAYGRVKFKKTTLSSPALH